MSKDYKSMLVKLSTSETLNEISRKEKVSKAGVVNWLVENINRIHLTKMHWDEIRLLYPDASSLRKRRWSDMESAIIKELKKGPETVKNLEKKTGYSQAQVEIIIRQNRKNIRKKPGGKFQM